ncbi:hypothetical protein ASPWEDRAFT_58248 [Aspergillus wentii DTO 134E9]|uniref:Carboxylic ester hydrolase n=1 Tax=Aspergillus wentii DTO 134E9 TaxID=1073089 RepID=A0A1L9RNA1_ASPWE|nr:uncharacterized protein ASPWEDRAFT_58248 [Aspergillus wentii DTO 134E9]OJJ36308.1 hypothetical protein ASPWEDRAFT_58248 [Aspergillus wentii DTO 134E9]
MNSLSPSLCSPEAFSYPLIPDVQVLSLHANQVSNVSQYISEWYYYNHEGVAAHNTSFCNVTVTYKHIGKNDTINVGVFLPSDSWNERMQGVGGNGYSAGLTDLTTYGMIAAVAEGYTVVSTDGGHTSDSPADWALLDDGMLDYDAIHDFGSISLNDAALIGKNLAESAYGSKPKYSYWTGCSQGGIQGLALAQLYPDAYDGIVASAPAINWPQVSLGGCWAQFVMNQMGKYPHPCELNAVTAAAVSACDGADGLKDGILSDPHSCAFDPFTLVGTQINCTDTGSLMNISTVAAEVANATWTGARDPHGQFLWYGFNPGTALAGGNAPANTKCANGTCTASSTELYNQWAQVLVEQNLNFNLSTLTHQQFDHLFRKSLQQWKTVFGTDNPDLSRFRDAGGKMLTYHGLMDEVIPPNGTRSYYEAVTAGDANVNEYYRLFEAPMMGHCYGGQGGQPSTMFDSLVAWVESDTAPDSLPVKYRLNNGATYNRILCPYPQRVQYRGAGNVTSAESFYCAD